MYRRIVLIFIVLVSLLLAACGGQGDEDEPVVSGTLQPVTARNLQIVTGQTVYVPAYSEIFYGTDRRTIELAVTLAIHNTDSESAIIIQSVRYYDTDGNLVRDYVPDSVELPPLATTGFVIETDDTTGGWGANFIVEWGAVQPVYEPVIEAIMIRSGGSGISLISPGRVLSQTRSDPIEPETEEE